MTQDNCRRCQYRCKCCNKNGYKGDCDLCGDDWSNFEPHKHFSYCPNNGLPLSKQDRNKPCIVTGCSPSTREYMKEAISRRFLKEHA